MNRLFLALAIPAGVVAFVALLIVGIGSLLLNVREWAGGNKLVPVAVALTLTALVAITATLLATQPDRR
jgi:hypothetical protein